MGKIGVAVIGSGNVGGFVLKALTDTDDMALQGIVETEEMLPFLAKAYPGVPITADIAELAGVDVAILCLPSSLVPDIAPRILGRGIGTVDAFDIHGKEIMNLKQRLHIASVENNAVSITGAGWDPGTDSMIRAIFQMMTPKGHTYTNFGPGISMGHTVEAKRVKGVRQALAVTVPKGYGSHKRLVYVELDDGTELKEVVKEIQSNSYFRKDETVVIETEDVSEVLDFGHGVSIKRTGVASLTHNQQFKYQASITNPAVTAQVMVTAARAAVRQAPGNYLLLELPLIDFFPLNNYKILSALV